MLVLLNAVTIVTMTSRVQKKKRQKKVYDIVAKANAAGRAAVHPGVPMKEFDRAARKVIEDGGYVGGKTHRFLISARKPESK